MSSTVKYYWGASDNSGTVCFHTITTLEFGTGGWVRRCCHCGVYLYDQYD